MISLDEVFKESNAIEGEYRPHALAQSLSAWDWLLQGRRLTDESIQRAHAIAMAGVLPDEIVGKYRQVNVMVGGKTLPRFDQVPALMRGWLMNHARAREEDTIKKAHVAFEKIHPFADGNGRIGRLILNWQRDKAGLPLLVIKERERFDYYKWFK